MADFGSNFTQAFNTFYNIVDKAQDKKRERELGAKVSEAYKAQAVNNEALPEGVDIAGLSNQAQEYSKYVNSENTGITGVYNRNAPNWMPGKTEGYDAKMAEINTWAEGLKSKWDGAESDGTTTFLGRTYTNDKAPSAAMQDRLRAERIAGLYHEYGKPEMAQQVMNDYYNRQNTAARTIGQTIANDAAGDANYGLTAQNRANITNVGSQTGLNNANANRIRELTPQQLKELELKNEGQGIANSSALLGYLNDVEFGRDERALALEGKRLENIGQNLRNDSMVWENHMNERFGAAERKAGLAVQGAQMDETNARAASIWQTLPGKVMAQDLENHLSILDFNTRSMEANQKVEYLNGAKAAYDKFKQSGNFGEYTADLMEIGLANGTVTPEEALKVKELQMSGHVAAIDGLMKGVPVEDVNKHLQSIGATSRIYGDPIPIKNEDGKVIDYEVLIETKDGQLQRITGSMINDNLKSLLVADMSARASRASSSSSSSNAGLHRNLDYRSKMHESVSQRITTKLMEDFKAQGGADEDFPYKPIAYVPGDAVNPGEFQPHSTIANNVDKAIEDLVKARKNQGGIEAVTEADVYEYVMLMTQAAGGK